MSLVVVFPAVFLIASVMSKLSHRPSDSTSKGLAAQYDGQLKALEMPEEALGGGIAYDLFRTQLKTDKANAVEVVLKRADGNLNYNSDVQTAKEIGACTQAYENAWQTIGKLRADGYKIIVKIYCFEDPLAASMLKGSAVTVQDGTTVWLDDSAQNDGNPWLNPYSQAAQDYLYWGGRGYAQQRMLSDGQADRYRIFLGRGGERRKPKFRASHLCRKGGGAVWGYGNCVVYRHRQCTQRKRAALFGQYV